MATRRVSRRQFLEGTGTALTVAAVAPTLRAQPQAVLAGLAFAGALIAARILARAMCAALSPAGPKVDS